MQKYGYILNKDNFQVSEFEKKSKKLLVSLSVDDVAIRKHVELKRNGDIVGYPDLGVDNVDLGGGPTTNPASYVMVFMLTAINDSWKVPLAYFVIDEKVSGKDRNNKIYLLDKNLTNFEILNAIYH